MIKNWQFDLDAEIVFDVCESHIEDLAKTIKRITEELGRKTEKGTIKKKCLNQDSQD